GIAFGLTPALEATKLDLSRGVKQDGAVISAHTRPRRITDLLVSAQVGASLVLLVLAGLLIRNSREVAKVDPGYDLDSLVDVQFDGPRAKLIERLDNDPRFSGITEVWRTPLYGGLNQLPALTEGKSMPLGFNYVDNRYFSTLEIP